MRNAVLLAAVVLLATAGCGARDTSASTVSLPQPSAGNPVGTSAAATDTSTDTATSTTAAAGDAVDAAFWRRAGRACRPLGRWFDTHPRALAGFDPVSPSPAALRRFAARTRTAPLYDDRALTRLAQRLGEPATGSLAWDRLVDDFRAFDRVTAQQERDAARGDVRAWHRDYTVKLTVTGRLGADLVAAGAPDDNACATLLG